MALYSGTKQVLLTALFGLALLIIIVVVAYTQT